MRKSLHWQLGLLGLVAGTPFFGVPALVGLPLVMALGGAALGEWLYRRLGRQSEWLSLPWAAALGTPVCALACGAVYGLLMGAVLSGQPLWSGIHGEAAVALAMGGVFYSLVWMPFAGLLVRRICRRPFRLAPLTPQPDSGHPYRP